MRADARRNRARILEGAREVFARQGTEAQVDDIARRAGVGVGTVYRHFPTKEALLRELVRDQFRRFVARGREAMERDGEPFAVLCDWLGENAAELERDTAFRQAVAGAGDDVITAATAEQQELMAVTEQLLAPARDAGTVRADATAQDVGMLMCGLCATMTRPAPGFDWRRYLQLATDALRS